LLIPAAANQVGLPIIASGGFADGRAWRLALALGADAIQHGYPLQWPPSRRRSTTTSSAASSTPTSAEPTCSNLRKFRNTARWPATEISQQIKAIEAPSPTRRSRISPTWRPGHEVAKPPTRTEIPTAGYGRRPGAGLIPRHPTCAELVSRIVDQAGDVIKGRLGAALNG